MAWLVQRLQAPTFSSTKQYASEILVILLQSSPESRDLFVAMQVDEAENCGVDALLSLLAVFRKRDPVDADEAEYMENLFDCVCCICHDGHGEFVVGEGVELMVLMIKFGRGGGEADFCRARRLSRIRAFKVLATALSTSVISVASQCCVRFVDKMGLKYLFSGFMKKVSGGNDLILCFSFSSP